MIDTQHAKAGKPMDKPVMNFSLGVLQPRDVDIADWPNEIVSLQQALANARADGAVLVAASGNESAVVNVPGSLAACSSVSNP